MKRIIIRATTIPQSLSLFEGTMPDLIKDYDVHLLSSPGERLDLMGKKYGVKTHAVEMYRRMSPLKDLKSLWGLIRVFRKEKPYLVHSMNAKAGFLCMVASWICRVPRRVHTFTGLYWPDKTGISRKLFIFTDRITCKCATHIIPEGKGVMDDLQRYVTKKPMKVLGYGNVKGVDLERFSIRPEIKQKANILRDNSIFTFLFVGRIVKDKGINELIQAFSSLNKENSHTRLWLVGNFEDNLDPVSDETRRQIDTNSMIIVTGPQYGDDLVAYYAASDCFVFPSYREGFPNTVMEAGALGLPSIVTDINGSRDIIENGKNGIIIPSKDVEALYQSMKQILTDDVARDKIAREARPMIESRFEQGFVRKCIYDYYKEIM